MLGKIVVSGISLILVVGVIIGVIATAHHNAGSNTDNLSPQMKAVTQICQPTNYKETCTKTLSSVNSTDPKELIKAGILAISESLKQSLNLSDDLVVKANNEPRAKMALEDCKDLLNEAIQDLQATFTKVGDSDLHTMADRADDFRTWISDVIAYQEMCIDGFDDSSEIRAAIRNSTDYGSQLTDNVLTILGAISEVLKSFDLKFNIPGTKSRRLLEADGYPTWMSAADRKLLAARDTGRLTPNAVVATDGSGQYKSINAAINAYPKNHKGRFVIYVKAGLYNEYVTVTKDKPNIYMYGDGPRKTIITGHKSFAKDGLGTWKTSTVVVEADGFIARSMGFMNTAGPEGHQAVALRVKSDMSIFYNCRLDGYQDTLCYQSGRQFYRNCVISGTIDFLFGYGSAVVQNSLLIVRRPLDNQQNTVTADGRKERGQPSGLVIHNCRIVPEQKLVADRFKLPTYLGRPWKDYSRTIVMESQLADFIQPAGWMPWMGSLYLNTLYYAEYGNTGPGASTIRRVKWKTLHFLKRSEALQFTAGAFIQGGAWIRNGGVPVLYGLRI